ncbi:MAG: hypothetical protein JSW27_03730, partial [Phycisphaerales bacterium]
MKTPILWLGLIAMSLIGCSSFDPNTQLETVAKDWCRTIRASQIIPVYPLTEDLQVGDVFLVQQSVDQQHRQYEQQGFLPMDNHLARLKPKHFTEFYDHSFAADVNDPSEFIVPAVWLNQSDPNRLGAPGAGFPSYSFAIGKGGGFNAAVPAQSVPIGVSLMGSEADQCTITIKKGKTYGIDVMSLYQDVLTWESQNRSFLLKYAAQDPKKTNYIRVVNRVYLTGQMDVSIGSSRGGSGSVTAGADRPVNLVTARAPRDANDVNALSIDHYTRSIDALNELNPQPTVVEDGVEKILPGGTVKIVAVSSRAVMMHETFDRPLVVGYLGFDMAIGANGVLGPPIPTHAVLHAGRRPAPPAPLPVRLIANSRL